MGFGFGIGGLTQGLASGARTAQGIMSYQDSKDRQDRLDKERADDRTYRHGVDTRNFDAQQAYRAESVAHRTEREGVADQRYQDTQSRLDNSIAIETDRYYENLDRVKKADKRLQSEYEHRVSQYPAQAAAAKATLMNSRLANFNKYTKQSGEISKSLAQRFERINRAPDGSQITDFDAFSKQYPDLAAQKMEGFKALALYSNKAHGWLNDIIQQNPDVNKTESLHSIDIVKNKGTGQMGVVGMLNMNDGSVKPFSTGRGKKDDVAVHDAEEVYNDLKSQYEVYGKKGKYDKDFMSVATKIFPANDTMENMDGIGHNRARFVYKANQYMSKGFNKTAAIAQAYKDVTGEDLTKAEKTKDELLGGNGAKSVTGNATRGDQNAPKRVTDKTGQVWELRNGEAVKVSDHGRPQGASISQQDDVAPPASEQDLKEIANSPNAYAAAGAVGSTMRIVANETGKMFSVPLPWWTAYMENIGKPFADAIGPIGRGLSSGFSGAK